VDCGAIPDGLIESELFGAVRGAYTGAVSDRTGLFEAANHGTIFLDEISNTPTTLQAKLLRVLQEREIRRVGDSRIRPVDVRLIAATNQNLSALAEAGAFRRDLLYRLNVLHVQLPPLRDRRSDIPLLAAHFLGLLNARHKMRKHFMPDALEPLSGHRFPGNVRELQNLVERAFFGSKSNGIPAVVPEGVPIKPTDAKELAEVDASFRDLVEGRADFWTSVHDRYKRRDISRDSLVALVDMGLRRTRGNYKELATLFKLDENSGYRRLMDFLRRSDCLLDFRPYRKGTDTEL
jgi:two-component system response regulator GlrR